MSGIVSFLLCLPGPSGPKSFSFCLLRSRLYKQLRTPFFRRSITNFAELTNKGTKRRTRKCIDTKKTQNFSYSETGNWPKKCITPQIEHLNPFKIDRYKKERACLKSTKYRFSNWTFAFRYRLKNTVGRSPHKKIDPYHAKIHFEILKPWKLMKNPEFQGTSY